MSGSIQEERFQEDTCRPSSSEHEEPTGLQAACTEYLGPRRGIGGCFQIYQGSWNWRGEGKRHCGSRQSCHPCFYRPLACFVDVDR